MTLVTAWVLIGVPLLALGLALFVGRSRPRALAGYLVLGCGFAALTAVDRTSGAIFGAVLALLYAAGRGGALETAGPVQVLDEEQQPGDATGEEEAASSR
ncbi:MAG: hypothetical protein M3276_01375 [Actinomycetota bacterium]|nr:hypothetical protein [Actinomycetota bacterium]